jgi:TctA family transporter
VTLRLGRRIATSLHTMDYGILNRYVLLVIAALLLLLSGIWGLLISGLCALLGLACIRLGVKKMYLMGFLMLPTMLYFSGIAA